MIGGQAAHQRRGAGGLRRISPSCRSYCENRNKRPAPVASKGNIARYSPGDGCKPAAMVALRLVLQLEQVQICERIKWQSPQRKKPLDRKSPRLHVKARKLRSPCRLYG